jgi:hypothetical protein
MGWDGMVLDLVFIWRGVIVALAFLGKNMDFTFCVTDISFVMA